MRYYLIDAHDNIVGIVPHDARPKILAAAERLRQRLSDKEKIDGKLYYRAIGVVV